MPNRIIREGILTSERVDKLSFGAECFYRRLLSVADDFGRYYAHQSLLLSACFPLRVKSMKENKLTEWLKEIVNAKLVFIYVVESKRYIQILDFRQQIRSKKSKFPDPLPDDTQTHSGCIANAHLDVSVSEDEDVFVDVPPSDGSDGKSTSPDFYCKRAGKKVPALKYGDYVLLADGEFDRMVKDWGEKFAKEAITQYDRKYPNSNAIQKHTDHNRGIRDYVSRGYICQGKIPQPNQKEKKKEVVPIEEQMSEEDAELIHETTKALTEKLSISG